MGVGFSSLKTAFISVLLPVVYTPNGQVVCRLGWLTWGGMDLEANDD